MLHLRKVRGGNSDSLRNVFLDYSRLLKGLLENFRKVVWQWNFFEPLLALLFLLASFFMAIILVSMVINARKSVPEEQPQKCIKVTK
jgi:hypothetical protein